MRSWSFPNFKMKSSRAAFTVLIFSVSLFAACATTDEKKISGLELAKAEFNAGQELVNKGKLAEARVRLQNSLEISTRHNYHPGVALSRQWLGVIDIRTGKTDSGIEMFKKSLKITTQSGDKIQSASLHNLLGKAYTDKRDFESGIHHYRESIALADETGNNLGKAITLNNLGKLYHLSGRQDVANDFYLESLDIFLQLGETVRASVVVENMRLLRGRQGSPGEHPFAAEP